MSQNQVVHRILYNWLNFAVSNSREKLIMLGDLIPLLGRHN